MRKAEVTMIDNRKDLGSLTERDIVLIRDCQLDSDVFLFRGQHRPLNEDIVYTFIRQRPAGKEDEHRGSDIERYDIPFVDLEPDESFIYVDDLNTYKHSTLNGRDEEYDGEKRELEEARLWQ
jgi:hypothetical protein